ncbi:hypothetical protein JCM10914A_36650 [Paenibacillus sp. JCM 10914]|uniref:hypothetical protein n=1 Tax=Paenibacillus sp. JCM 10914 TaxID=1236974 RepID=UPI0003CC8802|nr:hypothetical protein [Paenibacillus sp. JCM 10914]GAE04336.1 hypothetical protein JCM10914_377 [Paenibacillus sp. JCM 10914]
MAFIWFMLFSMIETVAVYALVMAMFQLKATNYMSQALVIMVLANIQSFVMRNELHLDFLAPLISVLIYIFLFAAIMKVPVLWSAICNILGFMLYAMVQLGYMTALFGSLDTVQGNLTYGYILQTVTGVTVLFISWMMYKFRIGFRYDLEKLRIKFEHIMLISLIVVVLSLIAILFYLNSQWLQLIFFGLTFGIFLYYAINTGQRDTRDRRD